MRPDAQPLQHATTSQRTAYVDWLLAFAAKARGRMKEYLRSAAGRARDDQGFYSGTEL